MATPLDPLRNKRTFAVPMPSGPPASARVVVFTPGTAGVDGTKADSRASVYQSRRRAELCWRGSVGLTGGLEPSGRETATPPLAPTTLRRRKCLGLATSNICRELPALPLSAANAETVGSYTFAMMMSIASTAGPAIMLPPQLPLAQSARAYEIGPAIEGFPATSFAVKPLSTRVYDMPMSRGRRGAWGRQDVSFARTMEPPPVGKQAVPSATSRTCGVR